jgi:hypothetical protein
VFEVCKIFTLIALLHRFICSLLATGVFALITWLVGIVSGLRLIYISKKKLNFFAFLHVASMLSIHCIGVVISLFSFCVQYDSGHVCVLLR